MVWFLVSLWDSFMQSAHMLLSFVKQIKIIHETSCKSLSLYHWLWEKVEQRRLSSRLPNFYLSVDSEYRLLSQKVVKMQLPFATKYLCERTFSGLGNVMNKYRCKLVAKRDLCLDWLNSFVKRYSTFVDYLIPKLLV